jgi:hypothetical protein
MSHVIEPAVSGRSRCRGCGRTIARGELRFGERLANPYRDGDTTIWYHPRCAAYRRPEAFLASRGAGVDAGDEAAARFSLEHRRVRRVGGVERAPSGRARCRACRELIPRHALRIPLLFYEEGMFSASGFVHLGCAREYFGSTDLLDCVRHFAPGIDPADLEEVEAALRSAQAVESASADRPEESRPTTEEP